MSLSAMTTEEHKRKFLGNISKDNSVVTAEVRLYVFGRIGLILRVRSS